MFRPPCRGFHLAPSQRSSPQAISHGFPSVHVVASISLFFYGFPSVHPVVASIPLLPNGALPSYFPPFPLLSSLPSPSLPTDLSLSYLPRFPVRPPCRHFRIAPSQRSSPQAISRGFPCVHPVVASISLLPNGALPKLFPTISPPSTLSSLPSRSFPTKLSPSYFPRFPLRPPFQRSSPQAIFYGFPSVHPVPKLFPTGSRPSTLSSLPYRSPRGKVNETRTQASEMLLGRSQAISEN